ncbi:hypothetical protein EVAR_93899_1 [Eumeta japonica]|uniref:Uncharacterized protein n=1 Tax=Eumeta variegata TaxID=151549 RepID=A0A4C2A972_EUMVA|nr:hypothetical protein EVAR_93899_1 [Eumeta japonica]
MPTVLDVPPRDYIFTANSRRRRIRDPWRIPSYADRQTSTLCCYLLPPWSRPEAHLLAGTHDAVAADDSENRASAVCRLSLARPSPAAALLNSKLVASAPPLDASITLLAATTTVLRLLCYIVELCFV